MANELDELNDPINEAGREVNVIQKQLHVKASKQSHIIKNVMSAFVRFFGISYFVYTKKESKCIIEEYQIPKETLNKLMENITNEEYELIYNTLK